MEWTWESLRAQLEGCTRCPLCERRQHIVFGEGNPQAKVLLVGEGPGEVEDKEGRPFVGPAGQLLDRMLASIGLDRNGIYIANIVKCRPPQNRVPLPQEVEACLPFLRAQVRLLRPAIIVALGGTAAKVILHDEDLRITRERGRWHSVKGVELLATYHPSFLLRSPERKREAWEDLKALRARMELMGLLEPPEAEGV